MDLSICFSFTPKRSPSVGPGKFCAQGYVLGMQGVEGWNPTVPQALAETALVPTTAGCPYSLGEYHQEWASIPSQQHCVEAIPPNVFTLAPQNSKRKAHLG